MFKAIIFDFFDVIHNDPYKAWLAKNNIKKEGGYIEVPKKLDRGEISLEEFYQYLQDMSGRPREDLTVEYENTVLMHEDMPEFIKSLGRNYMIGLMSNANRGYLRDILDRHGYETLFNHIFISAEAGLIKPEPAAFKHILKKLDVQPEESVFIDDNPENVESAQKVGITGVVFQNLLQLKRELAGLGIDL